MGIGGGRSRFRQDYTHNRPRGHRTLTDHLELTIAVQPQAVEAAADLLRRHAPAGVSIEPPFQALDEDGNVAFDSASPIQLRVWLPASAPDRSLDALRRDLAGLGEAAMRVLGHRRRHGQRPLDQLGRGEVFQGSGQIKFVQRGVRHGEISVWAARIAARAPPLHTHARLTQGRHSPYR